MPKTKRADEIKPGDRVYRADNTAGRRVFDVSPPFHGSVLIKMDGIRDPYAHRCGEQIQMHEPEPTIDDYKAALQEIVPVCRQAMLDPYTALLRILEAYNIPIPAEES